MINTAHITRVDYAVIDGVILLTGACDSCGAAVHHGGGTDLSDVLLGDRVAHCGCDDYDLIDPNGVIEARMPDLLIAAEEHRRIAVHRAARRAARRAAA